MPSFPKSRRLNNFFACVAVPLLFSLPAGERSFSHKVQGRGPLAVFQLGIILRGEDEPQDASRAFSIDLLQLIEVWHIAVA